MQINTAPFTFLLKFKVNTLRAILRQASFIGVYIDTGAISRATLATAAVKTASENIIELAARFPRGVDAIDLP